MDWCRKWFLWIVVKLNWVLSKGASYSWVVTSSTASSRNIILFIILVIFGSLFYFRKFIWFKWVIKVYFILTVRLCWSPPFWDYWTPGSSHSIPKPALKINIPLNNIYSCAVFRSGSPPESVNNVPKPESPVASDGRVCPDPRTDSASIIYVYKITSFRSFDFRMKSCCCR